MKLLLIAPYDRSIRTFLDYDLIIQKSGVKIKANIAPLSLPTLAALTPENIDIHLVDEQVDTIDFNEDVDLVGITFMTYIAPRAYEIADVFRKRNIKVILGGIHATMLPEEAIKHADSVVIGEAENIWSQVVKDFQNHNLKPFYKSETPPDLANSPIPRWDLLRKGAYLNYSLQTTRGCPQDCDFCSVKAFAGKTYRHKPVENVIKEIICLKKITNSNRFVFNDDNIIANKTYATELFEALIPLKIKWTSQASVAIARDNELLSLAAKSGLTHIFIGIESISEKSLKSVNKGINKVAEYKNIIQKIQSYGIQVFGSFILGLDADDENTPQRILDFSIENKLLCVMVSVLTPYPGTRLFNRMLDEKRIIHQDWGKYTNNEVCYQPKLYSVDSLQEKYIQLYKDLYSAPNIIKRILGINIREGERFNSDIYNLNLNFNHFSRLIEQDFLQSRKVLTC